MTRTVFFGTPAFAVPSLEMLVAEGYEVVGVYTQPDRPAGRGRGDAAPPVKQAALAHGLTVHQPRSLRRGDAAEHFVALAPEMVVLAAYGLFLPQSILDVAPHGNLNVHPSLLPRHRGASPIMAALLAGDSETGSTIFLMDEGMDTGPILTQQTLPIEESDTTGGLTERLAFHGAELLRDTIPAWLERRIAPVAQDESQATLSHMVEKSDGLLDWSLPAEELARRVRAFDPWPSTFSYWQGKQLRVLEALASDDALGDPPGRVVRLSGSGEAAVSTGRGALVLRRVQMEGRKSMAIDDFLRGQPAFIGAVLERPKPSA